MSERLVYYLCLTLLAALAMFLVGEGFSVADENAVSTTVTVKGNIKSIDMGKGEMVFVPEGADEELLVQVPDRELLKGRRAGDKAKLTYRPGQQNITERLSRKGEVVIPVGCGSH